MKRTLLVFLMVVVLGWWMKVTAQSTSEIKINPLLFIENSSPTLVYERTFGKHMAWELGLMFNKQRARVLTLEPLGIDSFYNQNKYPYARLGMYAAARWYFSAASQFRGVFMGLMGAYTESTLISKALKPHFADVSEEDSEFFHLENRLLLGPILGYKQVVWSHWTMEGFVYASPYLTRQSKILRESYHLDLNFRLYGGLLIGYRF